LLLQFFRGHITELETGGTGKDPVKNNTNNLPANLQYVPNVAKSNSVGGKKYDFDSAFKMRHNIIVSELEKNR